MFVFSLMNGYVIVDFNKRLSSLLDLYEEYLSSKVNLFCIIIFNNLKMKIF